MVVTFERSANSSTPAVPPVICWMSFTTLVGAVSRSSVRPTRAPSPNHPIRFTSGGRGGATVTVAAGRRRVVIIGAGFGGLAAAQALGGSDLEVTVVDRLNYHLFQPLLYQVAMAGLSATDVAYPIRRILRHHTNIEVLLDEVRQID